MVRRDPPPWAKRIREARRRRGISQETLADAVAAGRGAEDVFSRQSLNLIENGRTRQPQWQTIRDIAEALNVSIDWIAFGGPYRSLNANDAPMTVDDLKRRICEQIDAVMGVTQPVSLTPEQKEAMEAANRDAEAEEARQGSLGPAAPDVHGTTPPQHGDTAA